METVLGLHAAKDRFGTGIIAPITSTFIDAYFSSLPHRFITGQGRQVAVDIVDQVLEGRF